MSILPLSQFFQYFDMMSLEVLSTLANSQYAESA